MITKTEEPIMDIKLRILELLSRYPDGLTMKKITEHLGMTTYTLIRELSTLEAQNKIQIFVVGASRLIKLTA